MTLQSMEIMEIVLDVIALCLCGGTIIWLIRKRTEFIKMTEEPYLTDDDSDFNNVLARSIRSTSSSPVLYGEAQNHGDPMDEKYGEVIRLADKGLGSGEISKRVDIPKGEVDLVVKIRRENEAYGSK